MTPVQDASLLRNVRLAVVAAGACAVAATSSAAERRDDAYDRIIRQAIAEAGGLHPPPVALVKAIIREESSFKPRAVSPAGARGLMQLMPATAARLGVREGDLFDPHTNIRAGVRLLAVLLEHYRGDIVSALVAYNAHPQALFARIPRNGETPAYVWRVLGFFEFYLERAALPTEHGGDA